MPSIKKALPLLFLATGLLGLLASGVLTIETLAVAADSTYVPPCNISPFISCGSVMESWQSTLFGFPNSLLGIAGFAVVVTLGVVLLAGAELKRWFWQATQVGVTVATAFVYWFFYQSVFVLNSLCPWCMIFWIATIALFWGVTWYNLQQKHIALPSVGRGVQDILERHPYVLLGMLYGVIAITILVRFWSYWKTLV